MNLKSIELKNFKSIGDLSMDLKGAIYLVRGGNDAGKSTLIGAVITLLTGERTDNLLKIGEEKGYAKAIIGEGDNSYEVELRFSETNPRGKLIITHLETGMKSENKTFLQNLLKYQDFDPSEFVRWSETAEGRRKQVEIVQKMLPEEVVEEIEESTKKILELKEERKNVSQKLLYLESRIDKEIDMAILDQPFPNISELNVQIQNAATINERRRSAQQKIETLQNKIGSENDTYIDLKQKRDLLIINHGSAEKNIKADYEKRLDELKNQYDLNKKTLEQTLVANQNRLAETERSFDEEFRLYKSELDSQVKWLSENREIEIETIQQEVDKRIALRELHSKASLQLELVEEAATVKENVYKINENIEAVEMNKSDLLKNNKLPVEGLTFDDDGLSMNGIRIRKGDVSTSQEMELAAKILIAKNPTTKVFKLTQAESLGKERFESIVKFANDNGYQGFLEIVEWDKTNLTVEEYNCDNL